MTKNDLFGNFSITPQEALKNIGLGEQEAKIYLLLLKHGECTVPGLVKVSKINKSTIYDIINRLDKMCLVSGVKKDGIMNYRPLDPQKIFDIIESKREALDLVFPKLKAVFDSKKNEREINILTGKNGVLEMIRTAENSGEDAFVIGSEMQLLSALRYSVRRLRGMAKKLPSLRVVVSDKAEVREKVKTMKELIPHAEFRFYTKENLSPIAVVVFGDFASLTIWEDEPFVIMIKDSSIAESFRNYFGIIWKVSKK